MSKKKTLINDQSVNDEGVDFFENRKSIQEKFAPDGLDTQSLDYVSYIDGGTKIYAMCFYIHKLPVSTTFATTYAKLFAYPGIRANVFIEPLEHPQEIIDKRVKSLDTALGEAEDSKDVNRIRKARVKYNKASEWATKIEKGDNSLYKVQFLFTIKADSLEALERRVSDFRAEAKTSQIEIVSCYSLHAIALLSNFPLNKAFQFQKADFIKYFVLDQHALGDIFNHTSCSFLHKDGVFLGHYMNTAQAFLYDPFDISHDGFGILFAGKTGTGKSACIKMLQGRLADFGVRFRTLDIESRGTYGEYALTAAASNGVTYSVKLGSANVLNPFDINTEMEYDDDTKMEFEVLKLNAKISYIVDLCMSAITIGTEGAKELDVSLEKALRTIITEIAVELYNERGIEDGVPDSLYTTKENNFLSSGRVKKVMPIFRDFLVKALVKQSVNEVRLHDLAYQTLIDTMREQVGELYYGVKSIRTFTKEEYNQLRKDNNGIAYAPCLNGEEERVAAVHGSRAYFDGQSTSRHSFDTPYVDYDISQVNEGDRPFVILVLLGYIEENDVKPNSANPKRATPLCVTLDELHVTFPYPPARRITDRFYRTARKRWVSPWAATQSIADFGNKEKYPELEGVFKNTDTYFLFRHTSRDRGFLKENTELTTSQVERVLTLGIDPQDTAVTAEDKKKHSGEVCILDKGRVAFVKVDYLVNTEAQFVESNVANIKKAVG